jgi:hypothetical protein
MPTARESPQHIGARNIVPTLSHSRRDARQSQARRGQSQEHDLDSVTSGLPALEAPQMNQAAERCFEGEVDASFCQAINLCQE